MPNALLPIDWGRIMGEMGDVMELEIVSRERQRDLDAAQSNGFLDLTDAQLEERIERVEKNVRNLRLPDGGKKLRINLENLREERNRRKQRQSQKSTCEKTPVRVQRHGNFDKNECFRVCPSMPEYGRDASVNSGLVTRRQRKLKPDNSTNADDAFDDDLRCFNSTRNKKSTGNGQHPLNNRQIRNRRLSSRQSVSYSPTNYLSDEGELTSIDSKRSGHSTLSPFLGEENGCSRRAGKRKASSSFTPQNSAKKTPSCMLENSAKKKIFVVLDEDDEQPRQQQQHAHIISPRWKDIKIYYPARDHLESVEICHSDMQCLAPCSYLSSPIMNFYIQYLQRPESLNSLQNNDYHFFNTFFYSKLEEALDCESKQKNGTSFAKLRRWFKGVNIFEKAYIFLPIHACQHWSLAIISIPAKEDEAGPIILHLDSLGLHSSGTIFENIRSYLKAEWEHLNQSEVPTHDLIAEKVWKNLPSKIQDKQIQVPQQENDYDCGLFVLFFMERFIEEAPSRLRKTDLDRFGRKWFQPAEASHLRDSIRVLLEKHFNEARINSLDIKDTDSLPVVLEDLD